MYKFCPQKLLSKTQIHFFFLTASSAQMAQTEEFMFQNVAFGPTVYNTGHHATHIFNSGTYFVNAVYYAFCVKKSQNAHVLLGCRHLKIVKYLL